MYCGQLQLARQVTILELTVPWEDRLDEAHERKKLKCKIEKVPRGIQGAKSSNDMAS